MPNGGVPMHMVLYPRGGGDTVLYCQAGVLRIFDQKEWEESGSSGTPRATLSEADGAALAWFLRYWLGEARLRPGYQMSKTEVRAEFEF